MTRFLGIGGHHSPRATTDEWLTPPAIIEALGPFDLDPCAPIKRPWPTAEHHYTIEDNGLLQRWFGNVWLNPPYGNKIAPWLARLAEHGVGIALIFARTETDHFFRYVWDAATALLFMRGRVNFHLVDGRRATKNSGAPTVLIAYGNDAADRLAESEIDGAFVPLTTRAQIVAVYRPSNSITWNELLSEIAGRAGGTLTLSAAYVMVGRHPKATANPNFKAKVRQILQGRNFERVAPATYRLETEIV